MEVHARRDKKLRKVRKVAVALAIGLLVLAMECTLQKHEQDIKINLFKLLKNFKILNCSKMRFKVSWNLGSHNYGQIIL